MNTLKPSKHNIKTYLPAGIILIVFSFLDVIMNSFFQINLVGFFPGIISYFFPLIIGLPLKQINQLLSSPSNDSSTNFPFQSCCKSRVLKP